MITHATPQHLADVAGLYRECFPDNFRSRMGQAFCQRFYELALSQKGYRVLVSVQSGQVGGFALLAVPPFRTLGIGWMGPYWHRLLAFALSHPVYILSKLARSLRRRLGRKLLFRKQPTARTDLESSVDLIDLAVGRRFRRQGIGKNLVERSIDETRNLGFPALILSVDEDNTSAIDFYESMGFEEVSRDIQLRTRSYILRMSRADERPAK